MHKSVYHSLIVLVALLLQSVSTFSQVNLSGTLKNHADKTLHVYANLDEFSQQRELLGTAHLDDAGKFKLTLNETKTRRVFLVIGNLEAVFYPEPNRNYTLEYFPSATEADFVRFDRTAVDVRFHDLPADDINVLIPAFNKDLYAFLDEHFYDFALDKYTGSDAVKKKNFTGKETDMTPGSDSAKVSVQAVRDSVKFVDLVAQFEKTTEPKYQSSNPFFKNYMLYSFAELEMMAGRNKKALYQDYFMSKPVELNHPAYMKFFNAYYDHFLENNRLSLQQDIMRTVNAERNPSALFQLMKKDSLFLSEFLGQLAIIKGLKDLYSNRNYSKASIVVTLENMNKMPGMDLYKSVNERLLKQFTRCKEGWQLENFTALDLKQDKWIWEEQTPMYTYFFFYAEWSSACKKEMMMMQKWQEMYGKDIRFVAINMDDDIYKMRKYAQDNRDQDFVYIFGGTDPLLREKFDLRNVPFAVLVDPQGKYIYDYTRKPSEGLNLDLDKIVKLLRTPTNAKTWQGK
jgi:thiol-disulfide isomerase/thioredoxin